MNTSLVSCRRWPDPCLRTRNDSAPCGRPSSASVRLNEGPCHPRPPLSAAIRIAIGPIQRPSLPQETPKLVANVGATTARAQIYQPAHWQPSKSGISYLRPQSARIRQSDQQSQIIGCIPLTVWILPLQRFGCSKASIGSEFCLRADVVTQHGCEVLLSNFLQTDDNGRRCRRRSGRRPLQMQQAVEADQALLNVLQCLPMTKKESQIKQRPADGRMDAVGCECNARNKETHRLEEGIVHSPTAHNWVGGQPPALLLMSTWAA